VTPQPAATTAAPAAQQAAAQVGGAATLVIALTSWAPSQGVMFRGAWGEVTSQDIKYQLEQHLKPENPGGDVPYFRAVLDSVEAPDTYTAVVHFKAPAWDVITHFAQMTGYQNITSHAYL
jgi:ABC-type transport system substrate-binding protein